MKIDFDRLRSAIKFAGLLVGGVMLFLGITVIAMAAAAHFLGPVGALLVIGLVLFIIIASLIYYLD